MNSLQGRTHFITGAAHGIGRAIALKSTSGLPIWRFDPYALKPGAALMKELFLDE
jgi:hypothetical protein